MAWSSTTNLGDLKPISSLRIAEEQLRASSGSILQIQAQNSMCHVPVKVHMCAATIPVCQGSEMAVTSGAMRACPCCSLQPR